MNPKTYVREQWDRCLAVALLILGLIALLVGWIGMSGTPYVALQLPYILSGGLLGIFLLGASVALWLSADLRDEWRELHGVRELLKQHVESGVAPVAGARALNVENRAIPVTSRYGLATGEPGA